jgi:hypothetical protein
MRRLPRILLNAATALSLALCLATMLLWVRSYWRMYDLAATRTWRDGGEVRATTMGMRSEPGRLVFARGTDVRSGRAVTPQDLQLPERAHARTRWVWGSRPAPPRPAPNAAAADGTSWTGWGLPRTRRLQGGRPGALGFSTTITRVPYGTLAVLLAIPAAVRAAVVSALWVRRRRRARGGLCLTCGYDLRNSPERCPECGAIPLPPPPPA